MHQKSASDAISAFNHLRLHLVLEHGAEHGLKAGGGPGRHAIPE